MSPDELRVRLNVVEQQDYAPPEDVRDLTAAMLAYLGHPDGDLRDGLIYPTFVHWIQRDVYSAEELRALLDTVSADTHLFLRLGEAEGDSVFTRAFAVLLVPLILERHQQQPLFSSLEVAHLQHVLTMYLERERDLRGFVSGKGWAHAVAHTADSLAALAACRELDAKALHSLLELTRNTAGTMLVHYTHGEDERLAGAALQALSLGVLTESEVKVWLASFRERVQYVGAHPLPEGYWGFLNLKHFLRSLYFSVKRAPETPHQDFVLEQIEELLAEFAQL